MNRNTQRISILLLVKDQGNKMLTMEDNLVVSVDVPIVLVKEEADVVDQLMLSDLSVNAM